MNRRVKTFLRGVRAGMDPTRIAGRVHVYRFDMNTDAEAMRSDWQQVGEDLSTAITVYEVENDARGTDAVPLVERSRRNSQPHLRRARADSLA